MKTMIKMYKVCTNCGQIYDFDGIKGATCPYPRCRETLVTSSEAELPLVAEALRNNLHWDSKSNLGHYLEDISQFNVTVGVRPHHWYNCKDEYCDKMADYVIEVMRGARIPLTISICAVTTTHRIFIDDEYYKNLTGYTMTREEAKSIIRRTLAETLPDHENDEDANYLFMRIGIDIEKVKKIFNHKIELDYELYPNEEYQNNWVNALLSSKIFSDDYSEDRLTFNFPVPYPMERDTLIDLREAVNEVLSSFTGFYDIGNEK